MRKRLLLLFFIVVSAVANAQSGSLKGTVTEKATGEPVFQAAVIVLSGDEQIASGVTDFDGKFSISPVNPGTYNVKVSAFGKADITQRGVLVSPNKPTVLNFNMDDGNTVLEDVVIEWEAPLIEKGKTSTIVTQKQVKTLATRSIGGIASQSAGVTQADEGGAINVRGGRSDGNVQFIDGVKVRGNINIPRDAIQQVEVITGGVPAQFGDATGGVISTTTRGGISTFFGAADWETSMPFDDREYNRLNLTIGGPLYTKQLEGGRKSTILSYLLSAEYQFEDDPSALAVPVTVLQDDVYENLKINPVTPAPSGFGVLNAAEFLNSSHFDEQQIRNNIYRDEVRVNGNITIKTSALTNLTIGGSFNYLNTQFSNGRGDWIMNWDANRKTERTDWYAFARFQQRFANTEGEAKTSLIKNAFYSIQLDYTRNSSKTFDPRHGDDWFNYGHIGKFETDRTRVYNFTTVDVNGQQLNAWVHTAWADTNVTYTPGTANPIRSNYTSRYFDFVENGDILDLSNSLINIQGQGGLLNGDNPLNIHGGLANNIGAIQGGYSTARNSQFRVSANSTFDIKDHSLKVGFEYEQRFDRGYGVSANSLWTLMRNLQNAAADQLDLNNPNLVFKDGVFMDTVNYDFAYDPDKAGRFYGEVRKKLGVDPQSGTRVDIDNMDPDQFSIDMFSADELLNVGGSQYVSYYGYDYQGNILSGKPTLGDFYADETNRSIGAFEPIYMAGYIQDQFTFEDLFFNVGVRIDRFDANQQVLKDQYVLYPAYTVGELTASEAADVPNNIGEDYVVYVNDFNSTNPQIVGYRDGNTWYNADGTIQTNPREIAALSVGGIQPYLKNPNAKLEDTYEESFVDYTPQVTVSPRISFQFPISDEAEFFAHYDLLVQRPSPGLNRMDPLDYLLMENEALSGRILSNPDLRPRKTTEYELGFQQKLTERSALKISAFYREIRDLMQTTAIVQSYPIQYITYGNVDFGTVKGFTLGYDLRRIGNIRLNANYTLQFADGSGSGANSGLSLAQSGQPNLRYIIPLSYDSRHQFFLGFDYHYGSGESYNGPVWFDKQVFSNAGFFLSVNALSGTPYSRRARAYSITQGPGNSLLEGQINGSRLPWNIRLDLTIDKSFDVKFKKDSKKSNNVELYMRIQNLLNTQNVVGVYPYTGDATDDGFLSSPQGQVAIDFTNDAQSFTDFYNVAVNNPFNFTNARRVYIGIRFGL